MGRLFGGERPAVPRFDLFKGEEIIRVELPSGDDLFGGFRPYAVEEFHGARDLARIDRLVAWAGGAAKKEERPEIRLLHADGATGNGEAFAARFEDDASHQRIAETGSPGEHSFENPDLSLAQGLEQELRRYGVPFRDAGGKRIGALDRFRIDSSDGIPSSIAPEHVLYRTLNILIESGRVYPVFGHDMLPKRCRHPPVHALCKLVAQVGPVQKGVWNALFVFDSLTRYSIVLADISAVSFSMRVPMTAVFRVSTRASETASDTFRLIAMAS